MANVITAEELKKKLDNEEELYLIDVLAAESYDARHIPTAINIPNGPELVKQAEEHGIPKDAEVIVYCASSSCGASPAAAAALEKAGFTNVTDFEDGLAGWIEAGYQLES